MFKKSVYVIIIQIFGVMLGLVSIYFIVGDMAPEVYSLVGVHTVIGAIMVTFSDLGIETTMLREALYWVENGNEERVKEFATQAICSRFIGIGLLLPFLGVYAFYLNQTQYGGAYSLLLGAYLVGGIIGTMNNSMSLIVRSKGGYVFAQMARTLNSYFAKFVGIAVYFLAGTTPYLLFVGLANIPLFLVLIIYTRKCYSFKYIKVKETFGKIWAFKLWWIKTDLEYFKNSADSLLVSLLFPAAIMGSYTVFKTMEDISKTFVEGFFDVLSQDSVKNKGDYEALCKREKKIKLVRNYFIGIIGAGTILFFIKADFFVYLVNLGKYQHMNYLVTCVGIITIIHLIGKYEINAVAFFASSKTNLIISVIGGLLSVSAFVLVFVFPSIFGILGYKITTYCVFSIIAIIMIKTPIHQVFFFIFAPQ